MMRQRGVPTRIVADEALYRSRSAGGASGAGAANGGSVGLYANRPSNAAAGASFTSTDGQIQWTFDGVVWRPNLLGTLGTQCLPASAFTVHQSFANATIVDDHGGLLVSQAHVGSGEDSAFYDLAIPGGAGSAMTFTCAFLPLAGQDIPGQGFASYSITGIGIYRTSDAANEYFIVYADNLGVEKFQVSTKTSLTAAASVQSSEGANPMLFGPVLWMRVHYNTVSSNFEWSYSNDGVHWQIMWSDHVYSPTPPDRVGFSTNAEGGRCQMFVYSELLVGS